MSRTRGSSDEFDELKSTIIDLQKRLEAAEARKPALSGGLVKSPDPYDGKSPLQLKEFLSQVNLVFKLQPSAFSDDHGKIMFVASRLRGSAFTWVEPFIDDENPPPWMTSYRLFAEQLCKVFGELDFAYTAAHRIRALRQTGSAIAYVADFRRYASHLSWNEHALISQFLDGLKEPLQDELIRTDFPKKLDPLIEDAIRIDSFRHQRDVQRGRSKPSAPPLKNHRPSPGAPRPQVRFASAPSTSASATADGRDSRSANPDASRPKYQRLTEQQKDYRRKNNLCMYCGDKDHSVRECPLSKNRSRSARSAESSFPDDRSPGNEPAQRD